MASETTESPQDAPVPPRCDPCPGRVRQRESPTRYSMTHGTSLSISESSVSRSSSRVEPGPLGPRWAFGPIGSSAGLGVGGVVIAVIAAGVAVGIAIPATRELFKDDRIIDNSVAWVLFQAFVRIPLATALYEEVLFRGIVFGMLIRRRSPLTAGLMTSVLFGLWHILPTIETLNTNPGGDMFTGIIGLGVAIRSNRGHVRRRARLPVDPPLCQQHLRLRSGTHRHQFGCHARQPPRGARPVRIKSQEPRSKTADAVHPPTFILDPWLLALTPA